ncbi:MAG: tetratricopeptide repeat protein [Saprospiraceae bacterium]|nr:tetratricopeptide repeat protein [Saprospiraceae bacterium]MDZ4702573.1 tetratricopeptide repeat protein [Saprospiraceae bacterium]
MRFTIFFLILGLALPVDVYAQSTTAKDLKNKFTSASSSMKQNKSKTKDKKQSLSNHVRPDNIESVAVKNAFKEIEEGDYDDALAQLTAYSNSDADAAFGLGLIYYENDQLDNAVAALQLSLQLDPNQTEVLYVLGLVYAEQGNYDKAEDAFIALLEQDPLDPDAWYELGFLYYDAGFTEDADLCLAVIREIDPNYPNNSYED